MPQRFLKPGIRESPRWNMVSWPAQSLYVRLITLVDDYGRYDANPLLLARVGCPYGDPAGRRIAPEKISKWLMELQQQDLLVVYVVAGTPFLQMCRWIERARSASKFPAPPEELRAQMLARDSKCLPVLSNAAPSSPSSPSPAAPPSSPSKNNNVMSVEASKAQFAALSAQIANLERQGNELDVEDRNELRKKKRDLRELQERQGKGEF